MIDCSRAQHQVSQTLDGKWFEYFILDGKVYENQITGPEAYTKTPASEVLANWGACTQSASNVPQQTQTETAQPTNQLEANLLAAKANYQANQANSSGMGGDGIGWLVILAAGVWAMQYATRYTDAKAAKRIDADLAQEYERVRQAAPVGVLAGAQSHTPETLAETGRDCERDHSGDHSGDRPEGLSLAPSGDQETTGETIPEKVRRTLEAMYQNEPYYNISTLSLAEFKDGYCPNGGKFDIDKVLADEQLADFAGSQVFKYCQNFGTKKIECAAWYVFALTRKAGDSPYAKKYQRAVSFIKDKFHEWENPF